MFESFHNGYAKLFEYTYMYIFSDVGLIFSFEIRHFFLSNESRFGILLNCRNISFVPQVKDQSILRPVNFC